MLDGVTALPSETCFLSLFVDPSLRLCDYACYYLHLRLVSVSTVVFVLAVLIMLALNTRLEVCRIITSSNLRLTHGGGRMQMVRNPMPNKKPSGVYYEPNA